MLADYRYSIELRGAGTPFIYIDQTISRFDDTGRSSVRDTAFEAVKLAAIRESFGLPLYLLKTGRTGLARILKPRRATT
jgi:hypothetical protein